MKFVIVVKVDTVKVDFDSIDEDGSKLKFITRAFFVHDLPFSDSLLRTKTDSHLLRISP